jgi:hypothetical protein
LSDVAPDGKSQSDSALPGLRATLKMLTISRLRNPGDIGEVTERGARGQREQPGEPFLLQEKDEQKPSNRDRRHQPGGKIDEPRPGFARISSLVKIIQDSMRVSVSS